MKFGTVMHLGPVGPISRFATIRRQAGRHRPIDGPGDKTCNNRPSCLLSIDYK